jgi:hypothetical protein
MKEGVIQDYYSAIGIIKIILPFLIIIEILKENILVNSEEKIIAEIILNNIIFQYSTPR